MRFKVSAHDGFYIAGEGVSVSCGCGEGKEVYLPLKGMDYIGDNVIELPVASLEEAARVYGGSVREQHWPRKPVLHYVLWPRLGVSLTVTK